MDKGLENIMLMQNDSQEVMSGDMNLEQCLDFSKPLKSEDLSSAIKMINKEIKEEEVSQNYASNHQEPMILPSPEIVNRKIDTSLNALLIDKPISTSSLSTPNSVRKPPVQDNENIVELLMRELIDQVIDNPFPK